MQTGWNKEDRVAQILKYLSFFSAGSLFLLGFDQILNQAMYYSRFPSSLDYYDILNAELSFQFCFSIIAFAALTIETLSQSQKFIRLVIAALLSLIQFILAMSAQI